MFKFPKIPSDRLAKKEANEGYAPAVNHYVVTEKIHGTNIGVSFDIIEGKVDRDSMIPQSRNQELYEPSSNNYGAYTFMTERTDTLADIADYVLSNIKDIKDCKKVYIFGEYAGKGIQAKSALTNVDKKFLPFATVTFVDAEENSYEVLYNDFDTSEFRDIWRRARAKDILPLGAYQFEGIYVRAEGQSNLSELCNHWVKRVEELEKNSPFGNYLGVPNNIMEGVVINIWDTYHRGQLNKPSYKVKVKGDEHKASGVKVKRRQAKELNDKENELLKLATDVGRFEQAVSVLFKEKSKDIEFTGIGDYLKWINQDIQVELKDLIEDPEVSYKNIQKDVARQAKAFFVKAMEEQYV